MVSLGGVLMARQGGHYLDSHWDLGINTDYYFFLCFDGWEQLCNKKGACQEPGHTRLTLNLLNTIDKLAMRQGQTQTIYT